LIVREFKEEEKQLKHQLETYSNERLQEEGISLFDLKGRFDGHFFSSIIVKLFNIKNLPLSNHYFNSGDSISLSIKNPLKDKLVTGTVLNFNEKFIRIIVNMENWGYHSLLLRMDKSISEITLSKMTDALTAIQFHPDERKSENSHLPIGSYLSPILLGDFDSISPSYLFEPSDAFLNSWRNSMKGVLNDCQVGSVLNSLNKQISLIHGPPGEI
jgi:hypothetical protein